MLAAAAAALYLVVAAPATARVPPLTEILDAHGHVQRVLSRPTTFDSWGARWSPDGSELAWLESGNLVSSNAGGGGVRTLVRQPACDNDQCLSSLDFAWSPDGTRLLVGSVGHWTNRLVVVSVATGTTDDLVRASRYTEYADVAWSPDGKHISFVRERGHAGFASCCDADLIVARPDGSRSHVVFRARDAIKDSPHTVWSPDSRTLAFVTQGFDRADPIFAFADAARGTVHPRRVGSYATSPVWSPDSSRVAVRTPNGVVIVSRGKAAQHALGFVGDPRVWTRAGLVLSKTSTVWISRNGALPRLAFRVPGGLSVLTLDASGRP